MSRFPRSLRPPADPFSGPIRAPLGNPAGVAGIVSSSRRRPRPFTATATCSHLCVSTPTTICSPSTTMLSNAVVLHAGRLRASSVGRGRTGLRLDLVSSGSYQVTVRPDWRAFHRAAPGQPTRQRKDTRSVRNGFWPPLAALENHRSQWWLPPASSPARRAPGRLAWLRSRSSGRRGSWE
jgi:hypothetical protein